MGELIGRDQEMAALVEALDAARDGQPSTVLVAGDAGIGKTRLLSEFVDRSDQRVLWGGCLPLGERGVPYLALIEMLRSLDDDEQESLPPALAILAPRRRETTTGRAAGRTQLFQSVLELLEDLASRAALIVVVEDLHWADPSTRDLLDFLIGLLRQQRVLLVASFRTDDLPNDHPLRAQLAEWLRWPSVRRLDLEPLSIEDGLRLVAPLLDDEMSRDQVVRLVERGDGNPFFLEELAAAGIDVTGPPGRMRDILLRRTHDLSPELLRLLRIASAGGTTIDENLLSRVAGLEVEYTQALLRTGIEAQVLALDDRSCRFRHALVAEALHDDLLPAERREYHAAYADALGSRPSPVSSGELASHLTEAGRTGEAFRAWLAAAESAEAQFAFAEAQQGYKASFDLWELVEDRAAIADMSRVELLRRLAEAAFLAGDARVACQMAGNALEEIDHQNDPITAGLVCDRLARYLRNTDDFSRALAIQKRAVELIPASPPTPERAEVLSGLALIHQFENRYHDARETSMEAIGLAVDAGALEAEIRARNTLGEAICILEDLDRGLTVIGEAVVLARKSGSAHELARGLWNMQANRFFGGRMAEFVDNAESTIATLRVTQPHWVLDHMVDTADALHILGRWDEADAMLEAARHEYPTHLNHIGVPELLVARGQLDEARALVAEHAVMVGYTGPDVTGRVVNMVNLAGVELGEGNPAEAVELMESVLERYPMLEKPVYICHGIATGIRATADLARSARIKGDSSALEAAIEAGERFYTDMTEKVALPGPAKREVGCLAAQCDAELSRLYGRPDPDSWQRAVDAWLELSMTYRAAYCRLRWAENALASRADRSDVEPVLRELYEFLNGLGARLLEDEVRALARRARIDLGDRYPSDPYGLTDREREVLDQVARGSTNRQIAEALFISEKTASVHVSNILRKLVVTNRSEAASRAIREGLVDVTDPARGS